uniref:Gylcosyl hydrolase 115 C-terminal domain-containing protein n=1 Tax=Pyricularia oryzae (strain P131) TaxID=1143193 RepID=L7JPV2_PYRO1
MASLGRCLILVAAVLVTRASALGQQAIVDFTSSANSLQIAGGPISAGQIRVSPNEYWGVIRAANDLAVDFGRVTGTNYTLSNRETGASPATYGYDPINNKNNTEVRPTGVLGGCYFSWVSGFSASCWDSTSIQSQFGPLCARLAQSVERETLTNHKFRNISRLWVRPPRRAQFLTSALSFCFLLFFISILINFSTTGKTEFSGPSYSDPNPGSTVIIVGTIGRSNIIDNLVSSNKVDVSEIEGKWEAFVSQVVAEPIPGVARALVIAGSDPRGTIYGIYDVSEQIGVSPWYFWADVPTKTHKDIFALPEKKVQNSPTVKYRGFFINDEQPDLTNWVSSRWPDTPYGPGYEHRFYALVFEVLLRNRANYLWPAVWGTMFPVDDPANQPLADAYEVVMGTSHTEPLMRAQNEFGKFYKGPWAYNLNNETIDDYFRYGVQRAKPYARNSLWTVGMRGTGDTAISGLGTDRIVTMLQTLVENQARIMEDGLGVNRTEIPQAWCLYKEVQSYIFEGLRVPDEVTLLWADDNWGNVRRFPLKNETSRHGGAGVYYHFDYVGDPRNYKWVNTIQLSKTAEQAQEIPISHFFDMAYDAKKWTVDATHSWAKDWVKREFGAEHADQIAEIMMTYGMYAARRKFELVEPNTFSVLHYHEADAVLEQWAVLHEQAQAVYVQLDEAYRPAFFQMVLHPIIGGEILYKIQISGAKNQLYAGQKRNSANEVIKSMLALSDDDANLTKRWNQMLDGKWEHMMDQTHLGYDGYWQQPMRNTLPDVRYVQTAWSSLAGQLGIGVEGSNATVPGDDKYHENTSNNLRVPPMDPYGPITRYFDLFSRGVDVCEWNASPWQPWVKLSAYNGRVGGQDDIRVFIQIDWDAVPSNVTSTVVNINITTPCRSKDRYGYGLPMVQVPINKRSVSGNYSQGFVEADGVVSIEGEHYQRVVNASQPSNTSLSYHTFKNYGRTMSGVGLWPLDTDKVTVEEAPALEYDLYLFSNHSTANVTVLISPTHNYLGDRTPLAYAVADAVWGRQGNFTTSRFSVPRPGAHKLRIWALMPSVVVQKVIIDMGGVRPSYLGPPESFLLGRDKMGEYNQTSFLNAPGAVGGAGNGNLTRIGMAKEGGAARVGVGAAGLWLLVGWFAVFLM